jgi:carbamate kinase
MLIVAALGGNALLRRGEAASVANQRRNVAVSVAALAPLARRHQLLITHGNGPQVGLLALQAAAATDGEPYPLDVLGAESEGMIGYLLEQELVSRLPEIEVATLLTQVLVDADDPALERPDKPIGPVYDEATARRIGAERAWTIGRDGERWRRIVPSPEPRRILELYTIRKLIGAGVLVICVGGGGVPVFQGPRGGLCGVEAVVDKDLSAALLADALEADALLLLTDVPYVERDHGSARAAPIREATIEEMRALEFEPGSMLPKVEAACRFARLPERIAAIGSLRDAAAILAGETGTRITSVGGQTDHRSLPSGKSTESRSAASAGRDCGGTQMDRRRPPKTLRIQ